MDKIILNNYIPNRDKKIFMQYYLNNCENNSSLNRLQLIILYFMFSDDNYIYTNDSINIKEYINLTNMMTIIVLTQILTLFCVVLSNDVVL